MTDDETVEQSLADAYNYTQRLRSPLRAINALHDTATSHNQDDDPGKTLGAILAHIDSLANAIDAVDNETHPKRATDDDLRSHAARLNAVGTCLAQLETHGATTPKAAEHVLAHLRDAAAEMTSSHAANILRDARHAINDAYQAR